ncbi:hypothetical protein SLEP1_g50688 [Rubroshorea leprosula]|uniref:Uncharacterized protein n=1 Tax=Rubroshorea leprosula TaxID=152421 RepID=A0AAV5M136_9ROSI|nr:hypothetical protein SLEP1_g50688 [Rubroshorea leprosula]
MELDKYWCSSDSHSFRWSKCCGEPSTGRCYDQIVSINTLVVSRSKLPWWTILWRRLKREKKKIFICSSSNEALNVSYDPYTYAKNFDQGLMSDPEDISRSFSARFAVPSRIFEKGGLKV